MATALNTTTSKGAGNYVGETRKQLRDGFGVYNYPNKFFRYEGEWSKGKKHGHGKLLMADGSFYEGQFIDGEIQGHGFRRWASTKNEYTGQFVRGEMMGHGIMDYGYGSSYEGEWRNNQKEGKGKYVKDGSLYEGSFHDNMKHGEGKLSYSNGNVYEGDWVKDLHQGHGVMKYEDGTIYAGQWWGGEMHGEGSMIHASGLSFEGLWIGGRPAAEAVAVRVVGKPQQDVMQGRPFGFEVECVSLNGERVPEDGRLLQVTGWTRIYGKKSAAKSSDTDERLPTPFGFDVEPYYLTESLGDMSADNILYGGLNAPSSVMSTRPLQTSSPSESTLDVQIPLDNGSDNGDKEGSVTESHHDLNALNRQTVGSQASTTINTINMSIDKGTGDIDQQPLPSPPSTVRTTQGKAIFENLYLPPLPIGAKSFTSLHEVEIRPEQSTRRASLMKWKKAGSVINPSLLSNTPTISEGGSKKKKEALSDIVEKADPKFKKSKEMKRDEKSADDKVCKPGDYVIVVQDVTIPRFLDSRLQPTFVHIRMIPKKRDKSKIDVRRNWMERQENLRQAEKERSDGNPT